MYNECYAERSHAVDAESAPRERGLLFPAG